MAHKGREREADLMRGSFSSSVQPSPVQSSSAAQTRKAKQGNEGADTNTDTVRFGMVSRGSRNGMRRAVNELGMADGNEQQSIFVTCTVQVGTPEVLA